jgi:hypothetical protein
VALDLTYHAIRHVSYQRCGIAALELTILRFAQRQHTASNRPARMGYRRPRTTPLKASPVAKPNYQFEKRQRELAKKRKKEEKAQRKTFPGGETLPEPQPGDAPPATDDKTP